jgi:hypothetical protein
MCRSIKTLRQPAVDAAEADIHAAALQFVRKVSGYRQPSRANQAAFTQAVEEIAGSTRRLLDALGPARQARQAPQVTREPAGR